MVLLHQDYKTNYGFPPLLSIQEYGHEVHSFIKLEWQRIAKELKPLKTFVIVIGVLLSCFIPYSISAYLLEECNCIPVTLHIIFSELIAINSIINPFIHGIRQKKCLWTTS